MSGRIHHRSIIPIHANFSAHTLCGFHTNPFGFFGVGKISVIHHSKQNHRCIFNPCVRCRLWVHTRRDKKAQRRNSAYLLPVEIMNLENRVVISERYGLSNIRACFDKAPQNLASSLNWLR